jgi:Uncharacterized protein conserved in bacteria (DUF2184)
MLKFSAKDAHKVHSSMSGRNWAPLEVTSEDVAEYNALRQVGIGFDQNYIAEICNALNMAAAMDSNDVGINPAPGQLQSTAAIPSLVQFLQAWMPGFVNFISAARKIDELIGMSTIGSWEDEQIVQGMLEPTGNAIPYGDYSNIPLSSWNVNFEWRTVVRFEMGILVGLLEEARAARMRVSTSGEKRGQAGRALDIQRNRVGFYGYNDGAGRTYGFLNDPSLPAYQTVANGATSGTPGWATKTFNDITADIRLALATLQIQSFDTIDVEKSPITMAIPMGTNQYLTVTQSVGGISVREWLRENYPNVRVVTAPELRDGNGGSSVMYVYAERVDDGSSDDGKTFIQIVPSKFQALGVEKRAKSYVEDYANACAGIMLKRPYAVVRFTGL